MDEHWHVVKGREVRLCHGHYNSWTARATRLLTLPLIDRGHLSPHNRSGFGSTVIAQDAIDFDNPKVTIPKAWGAVWWIGNVPAGLLERIPVLA